MECHQRGLHLRIILARSEQSYPLASLCDVLPEIVAARDSHPTSTLRRGGRGCPHNSATWCRGPKRKRKQQRERATSQEKATPQRAKTAARALPSRHTRSTALPQLLPTQTAHDTNSAAKPTDEPEAPRLLPAPCRASALARLHHRSCLRPPTAYDTQELADELKAPKLLPALCRAAALTQLHHRSCFRPPTAYDTHERQSLPTNRKPQSCVRAVSSLLACPTARLPLLAVAARPPTSCQEPLKNRKPRNNQMYPMPCPAFSPCQPA